MSGRTGQGKVQVQVLRGNHPQVVHNKLPIGVVLEIINAQRLTENHYGHLAALVCQDLQNPWLVWDVGKALHNAHCLLHQSQDLHTHTHTHTHTHLPVSTTYIAALSMQKVCCVVLG